jgi:hypothetical protein
MLAATLPSHAAFHAIYDVLGVRDNGNFANAGIATSIHCSNISGSDVKVRVHVFRDNGGTSGTVLTRTVPGLGSLTFSTHATELFSDETNILNTGGVQGRARIFTEVPAAIVCAADLLDANFPPGFVAPRRMIRLPRDMSGGED